MIKIIFKSLERSQLAHDIVTEKFESLIEKFPDLNNHKIEVYLSMHNSFTKAGRDEFAIKVIVVGKKYGGVILEKKDISLYKAADDLILNMLERLNRKGDKTRVRQRRLSRREKAVLAE